MSWQDIHLPFCLVNKLRYFFCNLLQARESDFFGANPARQVQKRRVSGIVARSGTILFFGACRKHGRAKGNYPAWSLKAKENTERNCSSLQQMRCC
jgi:hypothetical protein